MAIQLRPHQQAAVKTCKAKDFGTITDTCGSGKSYIEDELIFDAFDNGANVVIYGAHRLDLILQQKRSLLRYGAARHNPYIYNDNRKDFIILEVSSAIRNNIIDENTHTVTEVGHDNTTTISEITAVINDAFLHDQKLLIYFCFASAERLYSALQGVKKKANLVVMDEAHYGNMSINETDQDFNRHLFRNVTERMYFFTATPTDLTLKYCGLEVMPVIHQYNYGDALKDKTVLPFTVHWLTDADDE